MRVMLAAISALTLSLTLTACQSSECDPSQDGCRYVVEGVTYQTFEGVPWTACLWEDAQGPCLWDAGLDSDGYGSSYIVRADGTWFDIVTGNEP